MAISRRLVVDWNVLSPSDGVNRCAGFPDFYHFCSKALEGSGKVLCDNKRRKLLAAVGVRVHDLCHLERQYFREGLYLGLNTFLRLLYSWSKSYLPLLPSACCAGKC